jgi:hypothetical protein
MSSGGILAAKEFLEPLVLKVTSGGTRAIQFLLGLAEPVAHLYSSMNDGGGGSGAGNNEIT